MSIMPPRDDSYGGRSGRKRFASLPSPTLTNPDMVLPDDPRKLSLLPSPTRNARRERPPSPSYLRHRANDVSSVRVGSVGTGDVAARRREKRGLMSRKMMMLRRSRAASNGLENQQYGSPTSPRNQSYKKPVLMDVGKLAAAEEPESKWSNDESSAESEDMSGLPDFLSKYKQSAASATDDDDLDGSTAVDPLTHAPSTLGSSDAERLQKEKDEQHSAILSKRAEQILANAKKRLNLMEGNLRGARDLVAPLTAANLKRATSVASYVPPINNYGGINRYVEGDYHYNADTRQTYRTLHAQASNPVLSRDYQGHWRGYSETQIQERPSTALDGMDSSPIVAQGLVPSKAADPSWSRTLKGSRSHDSLGIMSMHRPGSRDQYRTKGSPDLNLEPVVEDDGPVHSHHSSTSSRAESRTESHKTTSNTDDLHEQMSSLRGRISVLKERAREDSLRRRSMQTLREPSPLNNAVSNAPELFYTSSPTYGPSGLDTEAGVEYTNQQRNGTANTPRNTGISTPTPSLTGSRNAFAEQAQRQQQRAHSSSSSSSVSTVKKSIPPRKDRAAMHKRTPSGTAVIQSSKHRYSHHQLYQVHDMQDTHADDPDPEDEIGTAHDGNSRYGDDEQSEIGASVYEDAPSEPLPIVVAHEDREDAFDYENFFLHSAMSYYADEPHHSARRGSIDSDISADSVSTARGPAAADVLSSYVDFNSDNDTYTPLPPEPKTPEKLRKIEKGLQHTRTFSEESITSFATATEGRETSERLSTLSSGVSSARISTAMEWPVRPSDSPGRSATVVPVKPRQIDISRSSDSSSERADSGVGLNHGQQEPQQQQRRAIPTAIHHNSSLSSSATLPTATMLSPATSPQTPSSPDPATQVVNAVLLPHARRLGLRDKALMFGLVENLKTLCHQLQLGEETSLESRMLRRRLDDARRVLAGGGEVRPGTS